MNRDTVSRDPAPHLEGLWLEGLDNPLILNHGMTGGLADAAPGLPEAVPNAGAGRVTADGLTPHDGLRGLGSEPQGEASGEQGGGQGQFTELVAHDGSFQGCAWFRGIVQRYL